MHNQESLYDQFSENEAPVFNTETPHANRPDNTQPYINNNPKVREAMQPVQEDLSYYAWNRFYRFAPVPNSFEQSVNIEFRANNGAVDGKNFDDMRAKYIATYKRMLNK